MAKKPKRQRAEKSTFADNLNRILSERGISQRVAAQMAGVSQSVIADWCAGSSPSDLSKVASLAKGLGVTFSYLCLGVHENPSLDEIAIESLFDEESTPFEGVFKLSAVRLVRKKKGQK